MIAMTFYTSTDTDGNIHVQNVVAGMLGQHHVHTPGAFSRWKKPGDQVEAIGGLCACGLQPGQARDGTTGNVTTLSPECH